MIDLRQQIVLTKKELRKKKLTVKKSEDSQESFSQFRCGYEAKISNPKDVFIILTLLEMSVVISSSNIHKPQSCGPNLLKPTSTLQTKNSQKFQSLKILKMAHLNKLGLNLLDILTY